MTATLKTFDTLNDNYVMLIFNKHNALVSIVSYYTSIDKTKAIESSCHKLNWMFRNKRG